MPATDQASNGKKLGAKNLTFCSNTSVWIAPCAARIGRAVLGNVLPAAKLASQPLMFDAIEKSDAVPWN